MVVEKKRFKRAYSINVPLFWVIPILIFFFMMEFLHVPERAHVGLGGGKFAGHL